MRDICSKELMPSSHRRPGHGAAPWTVNLGFQNCPRDCFAPSFSTHILRLWASGAHNGCHSFWHFFLLELYPGENRRTSPNWQDHPADQPSCVLGRIELPATPKPSHPANRMRPSSHHTWFGPIELCPVYPDGFGQLVEGKHRVQLLRRR